MSQSRREADAPAGKEQAGWKEAAVAAMMRVAIACRGPLGRRAAHTPGGSGRHSLAGSALLGRPRLLDRRASGKAGAGVDGLADAEVASLLLLLELQPGCELDPLELKARYFELAKRMHPDVQALGRREGTTQPWLRFGELTSAFEKVGLTRRADPNRATTWPSGLTENPYQRPEPGPRFGPIL